MPLVSFVKPNPERYSDIGAKRQHIVKYSLPGNVLVYLPTQAAIARLRVPAVIQLVHDGLRECEPTGFVRGWVWEAEFGSRHYTESPEELIVVSLVFGLIGRHLEGL